MVCLELEAVVGREAGMRYVHPIREDVFRMPRQAIVANLVPDAKSLEPVIVKIRSVKNPEVAVVPEKDS
jgi:hypothetical protein